MASIVPATVIGGRFVVERAVAKHALGDAYFARDQKTHKAASVLVLAPALGEDAATFARLRAEVRNAAKLKHRALVGTYGIGSVGEQRFVASEWVEGHSLAELVLGRTQPLSARGIYNVAAHLCNALSHVHNQGSCHGALRPHVVFISKSGRVRLGELGVALALTQSGRLDLLSVEERGCLAPEVRAGQPPGPPADVYGVGALLYSMFRGEVPGATPAPDPSAGHPEGSGEVDTLISRCLSDQPEARFPGLAELRTALLRRVTQSKDPPPLEFGVSVEVDVGVALSIPPPPRPGRRARRDPNELHSIEIPLDSPTPPAPNGAASSAVTLGTEVALARAPTTTRQAHGTADAGAETLRSAATEQDLAELVSSLTQNDAPRWMAIKGGLDHGPFTARELVKLIVDGEVLEQHSLLNMATSERKVVREWDEFREFIEQYKLRKADADHEQALEKSKRVERTSTVAKIAVSAGLIAFVLAAGGAYMLSRRAAEARKAEREVDLAALFESGKVKIRGSAGILDSHAGRGTHRASPGGGRPSQGFGSYEDAMNQGIDLGDATKGGGESQLRSSDVEAVMNRNLNSLFGCVSKELRDKRQLGLVQIDLAIRGNGQVMGASVNTGSADFKNCMATKLRAVNFPSFSAPRMGARYSFSVD